MNAAQQAMQEGDAFLVELTEPDRIGNDIVNFINKLKEWAAALNLDGVASNALHALYHWLRDTFMPGILAKLPTYAQLLVTTVLFPILDKIHDAMGWIDA